MKKIAAKMEKAKNKVMAPLLAAYTAAVLSAPKVIALANYEKGKKIMIGVLDVLSIPIIAFGGFFAIMGIVHYASANTEGDGPAKHKAMSQIAGGVMVVIVGIALKLPVVQDLVGNIFS